MMKEAKPFVQGYVYAQRVECEEPCEGRLSRTVLWEGEGETPSLYSTSWFKMVAALHLGHTTRVQNYK